MEIIQSRNYATKKAGKTEVRPFETVDEIKGMIDWFKDNEYWDSYLTFMFGLLLGRRVGDTLSIKWSDLFYENGKMKRKITTIVEQKTDKTTSLTISPFLKSTIEEYMNVKKINPLENLNNFIFNTDGKTSWLKRKDSDIYKGDNAEEVFNKWYIALSKDISNSRKEKIINDFNKQKEFKTFGDYLYYEVEYKDIIKSQSETYRRRFDQAAKSLGIEGVSTHSTRKSFGMWSKRIHPYDCDSLEILCKIFNHSDVQTTMHYIGLTEKRMEKYFDDMGDFIGKVSSGEKENLISNSPVITLRWEDFRNIIQNTINRKGEGDLNNYSDAIKEAEDKQISSI